MIEKIFTVRNKLGLHARPAALFVQAASGFKSRVRVFKNDREVDGKSIMGLMMLAAEQGSKLRVVAHGEDEKEVLAALAQLFENRFDEE